MSTSASKVQSLTLWMIASIALGVASCDTAGSGKTNGAPFEPQVVLGDDVLKLSSPAVVGASESLLVGLATGKAATIKLDRCPTDAEFVKADPLGTLICGQNYEIFWDNGQKTWAATGPNEALPKGTEFGATRATYPGKPIGEKVVIVWGLGLTVQDDLSVAMSDGKIVGTVAHSAPRQVSAASPVEADTPANAIAVTGAK
jgi:hypothetical protein